MKNNMSSLALVAYLGFGCISVASGFLPHRQISPTNWARLNNMKEDVSDAKIQDDIELDEAKFLADMGKEIEDIAALPGKDSGALDSTILDATALWSATDESKQDDDVYSRAVARMEAMAQESIKKHQVDMEDFAGLDVSDNKSKRTSDGNNGPLMAFSLLGAAITVGMAVSAPETITSIDLSTLGLPAVDISGFNVDLSSLNMPTINPDLMLQVSGQVDVIKESFVSVKDSLLGQAEGIRTSLPVVTDSLGSQVRAVTDALPGQVQATADSLMAQVDPIKDNVISYGNKLLDSTLPVQSSIPSLGDIQSTASGTLRNMQYSVGPMISEATEYGVAQLGAVQESVLSIQDDLVAKSNEIAQGLSAAQDAMLAQVGTVQNMVQSKSASFDMSTMMPAIDVDIDSMIGQARMSGDAILDQVASVAADAQVAIQSKVTSFDVDPMIEQAKMNSDAVLDQVSTAIADAQMAFQSKVSGVDIDSIIEQAKVSGDSVLDKVSTALSGAQVAFQSKTSSVDISSMIEQAKMSSDTAVSKMSAAVASLEMPEVETDALADRVKTLQEAVSFKVSNIEIPSFELPTGNLNLDGLSKLAQDAVKDTTAGSASDLTTMLLEDPSVI